MPRAARALVGGVCYQIIKRGNGRRAVFRNDADYQVFLEALAHVCIEIPMSVMAYQGYLSTNDMPAITETDAAFVHY
jgi:hypothetical protein